MRARIFTLLMIATTMLSLKPKGDLMVTSSAFMNNGMIPSQYTCEGTEMSPPLKISNIPENAQSLALIVHDPDAPMQGGFTHWVLWNMPVAEDIAENYRAGVTGMNSARERGYKGMCPPSGSHHYRFIVYALDKKLDISDATDKAGLEKAMKGHILATGEITGLYKKIKG
jgi:Raf kinase inhibitor-like YbhB/YbcL family protein